MKKKIICWIGLLSVLFCFGGGVKGEETNSSKNTATYSVAPVLSEHQTKNITSFYDIRWTPNGQEKIGISITNHKSTAQTYVLQVNKAVTNDNGMVDYSVPNLIPDTETLKFNFPHEVTVAPNTTSTVYSNFSFPNKDYNGIKIFGVYVSEKSEDKASKGVSNMVSYALPLVIRGNIDQRPEANVTFKGASLLKQNINYQIKVPVSNEKEVYLKNSKVKVEVLNSKHQVLDQLNEKIDITPTTSFDLLVPLTKKYNSGTYTVKVTITHEKQTWRNESQIKITKEQSTKIKATLPKKKQAFPIVIILIVIIFALSLGLAFVIWRLHSKKSSQKD